MFAQPARKPASISPQAVNGWRGLGALGIAFGHFAVTTGFMSVVDLMPLFLLVDLFFVLSGLLIAHAYTDKLQRASAMPEYIVRRLGRIWPVHAALLAVLVVFEILKSILHAKFGARFAEQPFAADGVNPLSAVWTNLLLIHSLGLHKSGTWNYPSWSLSVEFVTYVAFAAFCLLRPSMRRMASVVTVVLSIAILVCIAPKHMHSTYDYGLFRCTAGFFAGSLLYDVLRNVRLPSWSLPTVIECLGFALMVVWMGFCSTTSLAFAAPVVFCLFVLAFIQGNGLLSRLLLTKSFQLMAELSFAIYMVHVVILLMLMAALHLFERASGLALFANILDPHPAPGTAAAMLQVLEPGSTAAKIAIASAYFGCVMLVSYGVYRYIEIPGRAAFGSLAKRLAAMPHASPHSTFRQGASTEIRPT